MDTKLLKSMGKTRRDTRESFSHNLSENWVLCTWRCFGPKLRGIPTGHPYVKAAAVLSSPLVFSLEDHAGILGFLPSPHEHWDHALFSVTLGKGIGRGQEVEGTSLSPEVMELSTIFYPKLDVGIILHAYFANVAKSLKCTAGRCQRGYHFLLLELK